MSDGNVLNFVVETEVVFLQRTPIKIVYPCEYMGKKRSIKSKLST